MVDYKTLVIGASKKAERYANQAVLRLLNASIEVVPMGVKPGKIADIDFVPPFTPLKGIHTVSLYLSPSRQEEYFDYVINLKPKRVIFNPGTENISFAKKLSAVGIFWENACTLVLLSTDQY